MLALLSRMSYSYAFRENKYARYAMYAKSISSAIKNKTIGSWSIERLIWGMNKINELLLRV